MRILCIGAVAFALAGCQTSQPVTTAATGEDRPGCPPGTPTTLDAVPAPSPDSPPFIGFVIEKCFGDGLYRGTGVDRLGQLYDATIRHPTAPGYAERPVGTAAFGELPN